MSGNPSELNELATRWMETIWNQKRVDAVDALVHDDVVIHDPATGSASVGVAEYKAVVRALQEAVPDVRITVTETVTQGDRVAFRATVTGTHTGPGLGFEPSGRAFRITGMALGHYRDGKLVEGWNHFDLLGLFEQLGALKRPVADDPALSAR